MGSKIVLKPEFKIGEIEIQTEDVFRLPRVEFFEEPRSFDPAPLAKITGGEPWTSGYPGLTSFRDGPEGSYLVSDVQPLVAPSGIHLKPEEGTQLLALIDDNIGELGELLNGDPTIRNRRIVLNIQDWEALPEDMDTLLEDLQNTADLYGVTLALKWRDAEGPMAEEFEPAGEGSSDEVFANSGEGIEAQLLKELKANPADSETLQVYADFLINRQDPFGEWILLQTSPATPDGSKRIAEIEKITANDIKGTLKGGEVTVSSYQGPVMDVTVKGATLEEIQNILDGRYGLWIRDITIVDPDPAQFGPMGTRKGWYGDETRLPERVHFGFSKRSSVPGLRRLLEQYEQEMGQIDEAFLKEPSDSPRKAKLRTALEEVFSKAGELAIVLGDAMASMPRSITLRELAMQLATNRQPMSRDEFEDVLDDVTGGTR